MITQNDQVQEQFGRPIINANIGVTNIIESNDIHTIMLDTFLEIVQILSDHCGPYGKFAMITSATNRCAEPVFTKDGIGIVRAMEYMSVMQEYVRNTLAYMGSRVETAAGDGTTSSMIICAYSMYTLLTSILNNNLVYSYTDLVREYKEFSKHIDELLQENKYTIDKLCAGKSEEDKTKIIYRVAYAQAYTSSHGDAELAHAVATLFSETPKEAWNYLYVERAKYESTQRYEVAVDESQYTCNNVRIFPGGSLTDQLGTARIRKGSHIVISGIPPEYDHSYLDGHELYQEIVSAIHDQEHDWAFICPKDISANTLNQLNIEFSQNKSNNVVLFLVDATDPRLNDIICMKVLHNSTELITEIEGDYTYEGSDLKITSGLYHNEQGNKINPMVGDPDYPALNELLENLDKIIAQIKSQVANRTLNEQIASLQKLRLKLLVSRRTYFRIGGKAYDVAAATDVVLDAILAVKHSLTEGWCLGGNKTLYTVLDRTASYIADKWRQSSSINTAVEMMEDLWVMYCAALKSGITAVFDATVRWLDPSIRPKFDPTVSLNITNYGSIPMKERVTTIEDLVSHLDDDHFVVPIIQPVGVDTEIVKRFGELALKFVSTCRIVTPGGLVSKTKIDTI